MGRGDRGHDVVDGSGQGRGPDGRVDDAGRCLCGDGGRGAGLRGWRCQEQCRSGMGGWWRMAELARGFGSVVPVAAAGGGELGVEGTVGVVASEGVGIVALGVVLGRGFLGGVVALSFLVLFFLLFGFGVGFDVLFDFVHVVH